MEFEPEEHETLSYVGKHTGLVSFSLAYSRLIRFAFVILLVRTIGTKYFGMYAAMVSFILIVAPISTFGYQHLFVQHLARKREIPSPLFTSGFLFAVLNAILLGALGALGFKMFIKLPLPFWIIHLFIATEIWSSGTRELFKGIFQGFHKFAILSLTVFIAIPTVRLIVVAILAIVYRPLTLQQVIVFLAPIQVIVIIGLFFMYIPRHIFKLGLIIHRIREGIYFSMATVSNEVYANIDKLMLSKLGTMEMVGFYTVAFRVVRYLFTPVAAALTVLYPQFFRRGQKGIRNTFQLGLRVSWVTLVYAILLVGAVFIGADWVVKLIFGKPYPDAANIMKILSLILLFQAFSRGIGDALTGAGFQKERTYILGFTVLLNFVLNLILIPFYGAYGAAWASVVSEATLTTGIMIFALIKRESSDTGIAG